MIEALQHEMHFCELSAKLLATISNTWQLSAKLVFSKFLKSVWMIHACCHHHHHQHHHHHHHHHHQVPHQYCQEGGLMGLHYTSVNETLGNITTTTTSKTVEGLEGVRMMLMIMMMMLMMTKTKTTTTMTITQPKPRCGSPPSPS